MAYKPNATANAIFGYSFFNALSGINNSGQLTGADYPCLVMSQYDSVQKTLKLALTNPDLGFTAWREKSPSAIKQINITVKGSNWELAQTNANASITDTANGITTIQFTTVDGLPVEIVLSRVLTPQAISFDAIEEKATTDSAFDLTATASSGLPVSYSSSNTAVATISGDLVTIVGKGTSIITASQGGNDVYEAATPVEQTLTVIDAEPPVVTAPANITVHTDAGAATASNVVLGTATVTDNDGVPSITNNAPALFPIGVTEVIWTATDSSGNTATDTQTVTVVDAESPVIVAPADMNVSTDAGSNTATVVLANPIATDNHGILSITNNAPALFPIGVTEVLWTAVDSSGNVATAIQTVMVTDNEAPVLTVPAAQSFCPSANNQYEAPLASATDNAAVAGIAYAITGATQRTGTGANASGTFNVGSSTITWTVTDIHGNMATGTCTVQVNPLPSVSIPNVYAMNPAIDLKNTIYVGYGPTSLSLNAVASGASGYQYQWNTGAQTSGIAVSTAGTYTVQVTDAHNCQGSSSIVIYTMDVQCGNNNDKVMICHNNKTICVASGSVQDHINHGDAVGSCEAISRAQTNNAAATTVAPVRNELSVYPNPVTDQVNIVLNKVEPNATARLYNATGQVLMTFRLSSNRQPQSLRGIPAGTYILLINNGNETYKTKIIKQ